MDKMLRGCIAIGNVTCNECKCVIEYGESYLLRGNEENEDGKECLCVECCLQKGYAAYVMEKGEQVLTFFPGEQYKYVPPPELEEQK